MKTAVCAVCFLVAAVAAQAAPKVTGTYSSLRIGTKELSGIEISVVMGGSGYHVIAQCAEGAPGVPDIVPAQITGTTVSFQLPPGSPSGCPTTVFRGSITEEGLNGNFEGLKWPGFLRRGKSYWQ
jgi:hypothetical protein